MMGCMYVKYGHASPHTPLMLNPFDLYSLTNNPCVEDASPMQGPFHVYVGTPLENMSVPP